MPLIWRPTSGESTDDMGTDAGALPPLLNRVMPDVTDCRAGTSGIDGLSFADVQMYFTNAPTAPFFAGSPAIVIRSANRSDLAEGQSWTASSLRFSPPTWSATPR